jgi:predicted site-specific integrase-resolvase
MNEIAPNQNDRASLPRLAYSLTEVAQILGVSYITVFRLVKRGLLKSSTALRTHIISHKEIERFLVDTAK